jgi:hypothetical protein
MAYMLADTGNKVGFRPYGSTNPQCATVLSGLGQNHPFKPEAWALHADGLGDYEFNRPFDPWELHEAHSGMHGLGDAECAYLAGLGDDNGNAGTNDQVSQAADDLLTSGTITQAQHDAIYNGTMSFQDVLGYDPTDQGSWLNAVSLLQNWNSQLQAIEAQVSAANLQNLQTGTQPAPAFTALTQSVQQQRTQYETIAQNFINAYRTVTGTVPSGLTGMGILPVVAWAVGVAVVLTAVYFGYQAFETWKASINVQQTVASTAAASQTSNTATNSALMAALAKAQASGDTTTANTILATLQKTAVPTTGAPMTALETWLTSNMLWLGIGAAGLLILPNIFGGRRR